MRRPDHYRLLLLVAWLAVASLAIGPAPAGPPEIYRVLIGRHCETKMLPSHDPRPLKWVGRTTDPIALARGAFDFVDLGVRREDFLENLTLEFGQRGRLDLNLNDEGIRAFRIKGAVYGKHGKPCTFYFELVWNITGESEPIQIREA